MANQVKATNQADRKTWVKPELVSLKNSADALNNTVGLADGGIVPNNLS